MPRGPKGEKRPADVVVAAVIVAKIATGEVEDTTDDGKDKAAQALGRKGGRARAEKLSAESGMRLLKQQQPHERTKLISNLDSLSTIL